jgi:hypothetical protein
MTNASASSIFEVPTLKVNTISPSTASYLTLSSNASISGSLELEGSTFKLGINAGNVTDTMLEIGGTASISGATTLNNLTYAWPSAHGTNYYLKNNGSGTLSWAAVSSISSNSIDFDEFVNNMTLDANLTIASAGYSFTITDATTTIGSTIFHTGGNVGIGTVSPGSALDVKGTLRLSGATSGYVGFAPAAAAGSTTYTLPSADGTSGQVLTTNGSGTLSWTTPASGITQDMRGMQLRTGEANNAATTVVMTHADEIITNNGVKRNPADNLSATITTSGINGLRASQTEAASTWYKVMYAYGGSGEGLYLEQAKDYHKAWSSETAVSYGSLRKTTSPYFGVGGSFTPTSSGKVEFVDVAVYKAGSPTGNIWLELKAADGSHLPTGSVLATSTYVNAANISTTDSMWIRFVFRIPHTVTSGTEYTVYVNGDYAQSDANYINVKVATNTASGALLLASAAGPSSWTENTSYDLMAKVYVTRNDNTVTPPSGYDTGYAQIGWVYNNVSSNFQPFSAIDKVHTWLPAIYTATTTSSVPALVSVVPDLPPIPVNAIYEFDNGSQYITWISSVPDGFYNPTLNSRVVSLGGGQSTYIGYTPAGARQVSVKTEFQAVYLTAEATSTAYAYNHGFQWSSTGGADLAEEYLVHDETINAGDVVSLAAGGGLYIERAKHGEGSVFGVISTRPGITLQDWPFNTAPDRARPVALSGRVPVKISLENGPIKTGDRLTLSKTKPGYAMKMTESGQSVGIALENSGPITEKILVFVNLGYQTMADNALNDIATLTAENLIPVSGALDKINQLNPLYFDWQAVNGGSRSLGFTAEEMKTVIPEVVVLKNGDARIEGIDYAKLSTIAIAGIKEQQAQIASLSAQFSWNLISQNVDLGVGDVVSAGLNDDLILSSSGADVYGVITGDTDSGVDSKIKTIFSGVADVKISLENGPIKTGDKLIISANQPGVATKAVAEGMTLGMALEPIDTVSPDSPTLIKVFVNPTYWAPSVAEMPTNNSPENSIIVNSSGATGGMASISEILSLLENAVITKVQTLWAKVDVIIEGITKTYHKTTDAFDWEFDLATMVNSWLGRDITLSPNIDDSSRSMFEGNGAQASDQSKLDMEDNGNYLATYGVDSTRGEIQLTGTANLANGEARVYFDFSFTSVISDQVPIKVLLTPTTDTINGQLYTATKTTYGFIIKELNASSTGKVDWMVIARRKGYEDRVAPTPTPEDTATTTTDASLSPDTTPTETTTTESTPNPNPDTSTTTTPEPTPEPAPVPDPTPAPTETTTPTTPTTEETTPPTPTPTPTPIPTPIPTPDTTPTP